MRELMEKGYIGHPGQLVTLRRVTIAEGKAKGTGIIEAKTAGGLELDILPDAGLDIGQCRYNGIKFVLCIGWFLVFAIYMPFRS